MYMFARGIDCPSISAIFQNRVRTVPTVWYFLFSILKKQKLFTLLQPLGSPPGFVGVRVARLFSFVCCVVLCFALFFALLVLLLFVCFSSSCVLCSQYCHCLWFLHFLFSLHFSNFYLCISDIRIFDVIFHSKI